VTAPSLHTAFWETTNAGSTSWSTPDTTADRPVRIAHGGQGLHHQRWSHACGKRCFRRAAHLQEMSTTQGERGPRVASRGSTTTADNSLMDVLLPLIFVRVVASTL
jgi:hypothetical protein